MAVSFRVPSQPKKSIVSIDTFLGADFTNSPAGADDNKSPNLVNMIRDVPGKLRKCMGYETVGDYTNLGLNFDDVVTDVETSQTEGTMTIETKDHGMDITFTDDTSTTITIDDGKDIFDQDILAKYYEYFGENEAIEYIKANIPLPDWITSIKIHQYEEGGETYYTLIMTVTGATEEDSLKGLKLKFIDPDVLQNEITTFFCGTYAGYVNGEHAYVQLDDGGLAKFSTGYEESHIVVFVFPPEWSYEDVDPPYAVTVETRLKPWLKYYKDPNWSTTMFRGDDGTKFIASFGT